MNILGNGNSGKHVGAVFGSKSEVDVLVVPCENFTHQFSVFLEFETEKWSCDGRVIMDFSLKSPMITRPLFGLKLEKHGKLVRETFTRDY